MKVKLIKFHKIEHSDDNFHLTQSVLDGCTDWEEITDDEYIKLYQFVLEFNGKQFSKHKSGNYYPYCGYYQEYYTIATDDTQIIRGKINEIIKQDEKLLKQRQKEELVRKKKKEECAVARAKKKIKKTLEELENNPELVKQLKEEILSK